MLQVRTYLLYILEITVAGILVLGPALSMGQCNPNQQEFVCGTKNAEDLIRLRGTPWVIASHVRDDFGPLDAIRIDTHEVRQLYPADLSEERWDRAEFPDCSTPPEKISSHGLNVRRLGQGMFRLFVVNHGGRESIEIIDIKASQSGITGRWRGCINVPAGLYGNGVALLSDGRIVLSGGKVSIWRPGGDWTVVDGIEGGNGVEVSHDGRWIFVADWPGKKIVRFPVDGGAIQSVYNGDFNPDNLRLGEDGAIYVAGQWYKADEELDRCDKSPICDIGFVVLKIDPRTYASRELFRSNGMPGQFGGATTALPIGRQLWLGTFKGDRIAIIDPR